MKICSDTTVIFLLLTIANTAAMWGCLYVCERVCVSFKGSCINESVSIRERQANSAAHTHT